MTRRRDSVRTVVVFGVIAVSLGVAAAVIPRSNATFTAVTENSSNSLTAAASFGTLLHLHDDPTPPTSGSSSSSLLPLDATAPSAAALVNYDTDRDSFAGLLLAVGSGASESDDTKRQRWLHTPVAELDLSGQGAVDVWSTMKDFSTGKSATLEARLAECDGAGDGCTVIAESDVSLSPWPSTWQAISIDLGSTSHTIPLGRTLVVTVAPGPSSQDALWLAYDTTAFPARLVID